MDILRKPSRREFISATAAATAAIALPGFARQTTSAATPPGLDQNWADAGVIATRNSPYAKLKSVPVQAVATAIAGTSALNWSQLSNSFGDRLQPITDIAGLSHELRSFNLQSNAPVEMVVALQGNSLAAEQAARLADVRRAMKHAPTVWAALCTCLHCEMLVDTRKEQRKFRVMQNRVEHESRSPSASGTRAESPFVHFAVKHFVQLD